MKENESSKKIQRIYVGVAEEKPFEKLMVKRNPNPRCEERNLAIRLKDMCRYAYRIYGYVRRPRDHRIGDIRSRKCLDAMALTRYLDF